MPEPDFVLQRGDTASRIQSTLENSGGTPVDIQGASVMFKMAPIAGGTLVVAGAAIVDQVGDGVTGSTIGQVHYNWATTDSANAGLFAGEFEVTFASGTVQTFPNGDPILVQVSRDVSSLR